tara:strand:+ start:841 stop:1629 length:789 start_codon:yes stop_codon:yes gene_type:complete
MIKVSHEVPRCLLEDSKQFNDYDYCLPHLLDEDEEYREFFYKSKEEGRYIIMDNSLHELGEAYNSDRLMHWIHELLPNEFIIPDVWEDRDASVVNARQWSQIKLPKVVEKVVVVQAATLHEAATCYQTYKDLGYKKIAFSYGASYYNDVCPHPNKDLGKALGRMYVIASLFKTKVISQNDRIHLLGCAVPQEFGWYKGYNCIESIDTSNPVMAALEGERYQSWGLDKKPKANMNDYYFMLGEEVNWELLTDNLTKFRYINDL